MTAPRVWIDGGDGWQELPGIREVRVVGPPLLIPAELAADLGLYLEPQPTPAERALAILAPYLAREPLYRAGP